MKILTVDNLSFDYSDVSVLSDISFSINEGDFLGIIGSNGTGKSTLIKLLLGLLPCGNGAITYFGHSEHAVGYVSQKSNSFNSAFPATVREVVMANLFAEKGLFRHYNKSDRERYERVIRSVGMEEYSDKLIGRLSGGQQQRVFIARALIAEPKLIFLDEPTVGIDQRSVKMIYELISRLNRQGITVIMTNHDTQSLVSLANKLLILAENEPPTFIDKKNISPREIELIISGGIYRG